MRHMFEFNKITVGAFYKSYSLKTNWRREATLHLSITVWLYTQNIKIKSSLQSKGDGDGDGGHKCGLWDFSVWMAFSVGPWGGVAGAVWGGWASGVGKRRNRRLLRAETQEENKRGHTCFSCLWRLREAPSLWCVPPSVPSPPQAHVKPT